MPDDALERPAPLLCGDGSLIPVPQRQAWRNAAAEHLLQIAKDERGAPLPSWKIQEQRAPARLYIKLLLDTGISDLSAIVTAYTTTQALPTPCEN